MEAIGKFDFTATADDELSFRKGDVIKILGTKDNWYRAEKDGLQGFVPKNYITLDVPSWYQEDMSRKASETSLMAQPIGAFIIRGSQSSPGNFSISVRHEMDVQHFKVLQDVRGQYYLWTEKFSSLNELVNYYTMNSISKQSSIRLISEQRNQPNPAAGPRPVPQERRQKIDDLQNRPLPRPAEAFPPPTAMQDRRYMSGPLGPPSRPVETLPPPQTMQDRRYMSGPLCPPPRPAETLPPPQPSLMKVKALYDFIAEEQDELSFSGGDIIEVLDQTESLWWTGRVRGKTGLFPTNYTTSI